MLLAHPAQAQSPGPLNGKMFGSGNKALVVVLHGDVSKGGPADYHYRLAEMLARQNAGVSVFAMLRPGYFDSQGLVSKGSHNNRRDHYTKGNNALVARTISALAERTRPGKIIAIGHSGGAAQLGVILGSAPGLVDRAILVSCPCNITEWRAMRGKSAWRKSQSPSRFVNQIAPATRIFALVGTNDKNTFPKLSQDYVAKAQARGLHAVYLPVNGAGHGIGGLHSAILKLVKSEITN